MIAASAGVKINRVGGLACNMRSVIKRAGRNMITDVVDALQVRARRRRWCDAVRMISRSRSHRRYRNTASPHKNSKK
jgi:hypothetical protein